MSWNAERCSSDRSIVRARIRATHAIESTNVPASIRNAVPGPHAAISHPPIAGPSMRAAAGRTNWSSEFAWFRSRLGTSCGTIASNAGPKKAVPAPNTAATIMTCQIWRVPSGAIDSRPSAIKLSARSASAAIITRRRSNRSLTTPPNSRKTICGTVIATPTIESAVGAFDN